MLAQQDTVSSKHAGWSAVEGSEGEVADRAGAVPYDVASAAMCLHAQIISQAGCIGWLHWPALCSFCLHSGVKPL